MMLALDFCICIFDALYQVEEVPPLFLAYREILSCIGIVFLNAFSVSIGMIIWFCNLDGWHGGLHWLTLKYWTSPV